MIIVHETRDFVAMTKSSASPDLIDRSDVLLLILIQGIDRIQALLVLRASLVFFPNDIYNIYSRSNASECVREH